MYAWRLKCKDKTWDRLIQQSKFFVGSSCRDHSCSLSPSCTTIAGKCISQGSSIRSYLSVCGLSRVVSCGDGHTKLLGSINANWRSSQLRFFSSKGDGSKADDDKHIPVKDGANFDKGKVRREKVREDVKHCNAHAQLGEQEQKEWLNNEKLAIENKRKESPFLTRREKFKNEFLRRIVPWEKITVSWETFPYYIHEHTKKLLVECASSHLKHKKFTTAYGARLSSSSGRILLQSVPGTKLYRERVVRALARDQQVPLLVLDSSVLAPYDFGEDCSSESESDDDNAESGVECTSESEVEDENDASNEEEWSSSGEARSDCSDADEVDVQVSAEALKKLVPYNLEDFEKKVSGESESSIESSKSESAEPSNKPKRMLKKGYAVLVLSQDSYYWLLGYLAVVDKGMALFRLSCACLRRLWVPSSLHLTTPSAIIALTYSIFHPIIPSDRPTKTNPSPSHDNSSSFYYSPIKPSQGCDSGSEFFGKNFKFKFKFSGFNSSTASQSACISTSSSVSENKGLKTNGDNAGGTGGSETTILVSWIDLYLPKPARPYAHLARLDKPIGTWLLAWPCFWSITLAASPGNLPDIKMLTLFGCGALLLRGAGCTVNDLFDRNIDSKVERTRMRPVASGVLTPFQGLCFLGFQLLLGLGILLQLNNYSRILGVSSLLLVFSYPLMKRLTFWPQAYLGLTFNWGALLGWSAVQGNLDPAVVFPLYISGVFWTLVYDTIYAHQDKEDDLKVGVKSTALRFGDSTKEWVSGFGIACISSLALCGFNANIGWPFYAFLAAASGQLAWQIFTLDLSCRADCNRKFVSNKWFGAIIFSGILFGRLTS